jgi:hypothetical protein
MLKMAVFASVFFWGHRAEFGGGNDRFFWLGIAAPDPKPTWRLPESSGTAHEISGRLRGERAAIVG